MLLEKENNKVLTVKGIKEHDHSVSSMIETTVNLQNKNLAAVATKILKQESNDLGCTLLTLRKQVAFSAKQKTSALNNRLPENTEQVASIFRI